MYTILFYFLKPVWYYVISRPQKGIWTGFLIEMISPVGCCDFLSQVVVPTQDLLVLPVSPDSPRCLLYPEGASSGVALSGKRGAKLAHSPGLASPVGLLLVFG